METTEPLRFTAKHRLAAVAVVVMAALLATALAEGAVRLRQYLKTGTAAGHSGLYKDNHVVGLRVLNPGYSAGPISINRLGFRGTEITAEKPPGVFRIAVLGASTTFCAEVSSDDAVWVQMLGPLLQPQIKDRKIEVINGGVPGYTVASSRKNWRHNIERLKPDWVIVYHATNDLSGELRSLAMAQGLAFTQPPEAFWLARKSLLVELVMKNLLVLASQQTRSVQQMVRIDGVELGRAFTDELSGLAAEIGSSGAGLSLATFSTQLRTEQSAEMRLRAMASARVYTPFASPDVLIQGFADYNAKIRSVARAAGVHVIEGEHDIPGDAKHFVDTVHFSDAGSAAMARRVASSLTAHETFRVLTASIKP
jgi:lysophospholipase L1-like esterase